MIKGISFGKKKLKPLACKGNCKLKSQFGA